MVHLLSTSEKLINREKQKQEIAHALSALMDEKTPFQGLEFYGLAGIGKSRILNQANFRFAKNWTSLEDSGKLMVYDRRAYHNE